MLTKIHRSGEKREKNQPYTTKKEKNKTQPQKQRILFLKIQSQDLAVLTHILQGKDGRQENKCMLPKMS